MIFSNSTNKPHCFRVSDAVCGRIESVDDFSARMSFEDDTGPCAPPEGLALLNAETDIEIPVTKTYTLAYTAPYALKYHNAIILRLVPQRGFVVSGVHETVAANLARDIN